ncbi:ribonuclease E activity regulator RraA [Zoogloea sp.]|uniref:ribonuclease E activity regulator RraA n=1 Tax=Zoogloea sp. TaxID=49181 RepID=UPI002611036E|nr:ribonuclease E activity regulator RraA [Zoogloea sp.]MDD3353944.1 ribonuclease E activity regulator RraA [Zoogloea sp.]
MEFQTTDLCDANEGKVRAVAPMFRNYGGKRRFAGPIRTLKVFEDNALVRSTLETPGKGAVLVVDAGGSLRCAMLGDQLAQLGVKNGWAGVIMYGCIRDSGPIADMDLGVFALATHPMKSIKKGSGDQDIPVTFGGVTFTPGQWVYADEDGVIVAEKALA